MAYDTVRRFASTQTSSSSASLQPWTFPRGALPSADLGNLLLAGHAASICRSTEREQMKFRPAGSSDKSLHFIRVFTVMVGMSHGVASGFTAFEREPG
jgi:hypothetical protein